MKALAIALVVSHFVGDWMLQSREVARKKSTSPWHMFIHMVGVTIPLMIAVGLFSMHQAWLIVPYLSFHCGQDLIVWNLYAKLRGNMAYEYHAMWKSTDSNFKPAVRHDYEFYFTVALDQMLHLVVLFAVFL